MSAKESTPLLEARSSGSGDKKRFYFLQEKRPSSVAIDQKNTGTVAAESVYEG
jgi:hypothetical protein